MPAAVFWLRRVHAALTPVIGDGALFRPQGLRASINESGSVPGLLYSAFGGRAEFGLSARGQSLRRRPCRLRFSSDVEQGNDVWGRMTSAEFRSSASFASFASFASTASTASTASMTSVSR